MTRRTSATAVGVVAILLWAGLALATVGARGLPPFELLSLSFAVACLAGLGLLAGRGRAGLAEMVQPPAPWLTAFCGIFLYHALYFFALSAAPAAEASLIAYLWPLFIVLFAALLPGEGLKARHLLGALLGLGGTALILMSRTGAGGGAGSLGGYLAAFACALVWSGYSVLNRRFERIPSGMIVGVCGAVALSGGACHLMVETNVRPGATQWLAIVVLGLGPTGSAFLAWDHATKHGRLALLGALSYLAPLLSTGLLILAGQASASGPLPIAALLVIGGAVTATGLPRPGSTVKVSSR
ncbi:MAG TPA: DMT family transporter [Lichenihabitans sp.]|jgi:drug/metabolite transporter (DMT)-like permease|nr:DMT family transporter [Lichenihabitans sp.]